jgi:hypothetical protein
MQMQRLGVRALLLPQLGHKLLQQQVQTQLIRDTQGGARQN